MHFSLLNDFKFIESLKNKQKCQLDILLITNQGIQSTSKDAFDNCVNHEDGNHNDAGTGHQPANRNSPVGVNVRVLC